MNESARISIVILAGGSPDDPFAGSQGVAHASLIEIDGKTILSRMLDAFLAACVREIIVVGSPAVLAALPVRSGESAGGTTGVTKVEAGDTAPENIARGVRACTADWVVVAPADVPWITAESVTDFISSARATGADLVYPIVAQPIYEARYPGGRRTYVRLREGTFTGGNFIFAGRTFLESLLPLVQRIFVARKNPIALARVFGIGFIIRLVTHRLTLPGIEARASQISGGKAVALPIARPELAFDVDKPEDLAACLRVTTQ